MAEMTRAEDRAIHPWPGLASYTENDAEVFCGRTGEIEQLRRLLGRGAVSVLFGASGTGKTSLLRAGLFPRVRGQHLLPIPVRLDFGERQVTIAGQVRAETLRAAEQANVELEPLAPPLQEKAESLWEFFHRHDFWSPDNEPVTPLLVFDQFEELFTLGRGHGDPAALVREVADLAENTMPLSYRAALEEHALALPFDPRRVTWKILLSIREDYVPRLDDLRTVMPSVMQHRLRLTRMNGTAALEALRTPGGHLLDDTTSQRIVRFVAAAHDEDAESERAAPVEALQVEPALLSVVARELNNRRLADAKAKITTQLLEEARGSVLVNFYEASFTGLPPAVRPFVEDHLLTPSGFRSTVSLDEALAEGLDEKSVYTLIDRRLLRLEDRLGIPHLELTHDLLTGVVQESRQARREAEERDQQERERQAQRKRMRALVGLSGVFAVVALLAIGGMVAAWQARGEAERQGERAKRNFAEAMETVDEFLVDLNREELGDVPGMQEMREEFARTAVDKYKAFAANDPTPRVINGLSAAELQLAGIVASIGSLEESAGHYDQVIARQQQLIENWPEGEPQGDEYFAARLRLATAYMDKGSSYWEVSEFARALPYAETALAQLKELNADRPEDQETRKGLASIHNQLGNLKRQLLPDSEAADEVVRAHYAETERLYRELDAEGYDRRTALQGLSGAVHNTALTYGYEGEDLENRLRLLRQSLEYDEELQKLDPRSPRLNSNRGIALQNLGNSLRIAKRFDEAQEYLEKTLQLTQQTYEENPLVSRYRWLYADALEEMATLHRNRENFDQAIAVYDEAIVLLEPLAEEATDRPVYASTLLDMIYWKLEIAYNNGRAGHEEYADLVAQARAYSQRHTDSLSVGQELFDALRQHALSLDKAGKYAEALEASKGAAAEFERLHGLGITGLNYSGMAGALSVALDYAEKAGEEEWILTLEDRFYDILLPHLGRQGSSDFATVVHRAGRVHAQQENLDKAARSYQTSLEIRRAELEKAPWHWYLRSGVSGDYRQLAEIAQKRGDLEGEARAWQGYIRDWLNPMQGMDGQELLELQPPFSEEDVQALRGFQASSPGMKKFTVPVDFAGIKFPFDIYITEIPYPKDPLEDQARWLREERGGIIPEEVRDSFRRLHKIAHENNVSFQDLCVYALGTAATEKSFESQKEEFEEARKAAMAPAEDGSPVDPEVAAAKLRTAYEQITSAAATANEWEEYQHFAERWEEELPEDIPAQIAVAIGTFHNEPPENVVQAFRSVWEYRAEVATALENLPEGNDKTASLKRLHEIAVDNNVSFPDLMEYALTNTASSAEEELKEAEAAYEEAEKIYALDESTVTPIRLARLANTAADRALIAQEWGKAEKYARRALELGPSDGLRTSARGNVATAALFQGRYQEALAEYKVLIEQPLNGEAFGKALLNDFDRLKEAGFEHPDMERIREELGLATEETASPAAD